jgi:hypothetical protein
MSNYVYQMQYTGTARLKTFDVAGWNANKGAAYGVTVLSVVGVPGDNRSVIVTFITEARLSMDDFANVKVLSTQFAADLSSSFTG